MTIEIGLLLLIIAIALVLFSIERVPADVVALGALTTLIITGLLPAEKAFAGFGNDAVMMILGLLILTAALMRTGVVDMAGQLFVRWIGQSPGKLQLLFMASASALSSFISNTAATAFFIPVVFGVARKAKVSPSKLLMPLAFASILSSSVTLVATSTNIVVSGLMVQNGMKPLGMFELTVVGVPIVIVGIVYMLTIGRKLLPDRTDGHDLVKEVGESAYFSEVVILPSSPLAGKTLAESEIGKTMDLTVLRVARGKDQFLAPRGDLRLEAGDVVQVEAHREAILKVKTTAGLELKADFKLSDPSLQDEDIRLVEVILLNRSPLVGRTLKGVQFRERYGLQVLAINRHGETIYSKISQVVLALGDVLLIQGHRFNISALEADLTFRLIGPIENRMPNTRRAPIAIAAFVGALILGTFEVVSLPAAILLGVLVVFVTRCITPEEAYREVEWKVLILIGSMLGVGIALEHTGAATYLAGLIVTTFGHANPIWMLSGFFLLTMLLTQPMSNQAAAAVVVPIAIQTALQLGLNPRAFTVMIAVGASCSFLTPLEPSCLMVYGPGRYRFLDFLKVGFLLTVFIYLIAILIVPLIWKL